MTTKDLARLCLSGSRAQRPDLEARGPRVISLAAGTLISLCVAGAAWPALGQDANRLGLCSLGNTTITNLQTDVAAGIGINQGDVEIAFVVVYSLNNDNNGQPLDGVATGPILCTNDDFLDPTAAAANDVIPPSGTVDIFDSSEAFLLRYEENETTDTETRFCHTTNANVDCFLLEPPSDE
jgi:hypothetical protein